MKKYILLLLVVFSLFFNYAASAETVGIFAVADDTTAFGKVKAVNTLIFNKDTGELLKLTATSTAVDTLLTASTTPISAGLPPGDITLSGDLLFDLNATRSIGSDTVRAKEIWVDGASLHIGDSTVDSTLSFTNVLGSPRYLDGQTGLNDLQNSGTYSGTDNATFQIVIDSVSAPNTFKWRKNTGAWTENVTMTGGEQLLSDGISITFPNIIGHTIKDEWIFGAGYRMRSNKALSVSDITTVDGSVLASGSIDALGSMNVAGGLNMKNSHYDAPDNSSLKLGDDDDLEIRHNGTNSEIVVTGGNLILENQDTVGSIINKLGTDTVATEFKVTDSANADVFVVDAVGNASFAGNLDVNGDLTYINVQNMNVASRYGNLNSGYTALTALTGGVTVIVQGSSTADTVATGGFTAGVASTSNPTVLTDGSATFTAGDIVLITNANDVANNGQYEVMSHVGTTLTVRGIGTEDTVEDFSKNQFTTDTTVAGNITKVTISVARARGDGTWEYGSGDTTGIAYTLGQHWDRTGTVLSPLVSGDDITTTGDISGARGTFTTDLILSTGTSVNEFSIDGTLAGDSDDAVPTEKAVKAYVDSHDTNGVWTRTGTTISETNAGDDLAFDTDTLFVDASTDRVGVGTVTPGAKLDITDSSAPSVAVYMQNASGHGLDITAWGSGANIDPLTPGDNIYMGRDAVLGFLHLKDTADLGVGLAIEQAPAAKIESLDAAGAQLRLTNTQSIDYADFTVDSDGDLTITPSGDTITTGNLATISLTRTMPTVVDDIVEIGNFAIAGGARSLWVSITVDSSTFSVSKQYIVPTAYNETGGSWHVVSPIADSGVFSTNNLALDVRVSTNTAYLRIRRTAGSTAGTAYVMIKHDGNIGSDTFTATTGTGSVTAPTDYYESAVLTQVGGNVEVNSGDLDMYVVTPSATQSINFRNDPAQGATTQFGMTFTDDSGDGGMAMGGNAALTIQSTDSKPLYVTTNSTDLDPVLDLRNTGTNAGIIEIYTGDRTPLNNVTPGSDAALYFRDDTTNSAVYFANDQLSSTWAELFQLNPDGTATFGSSVTIGTNLVINEAGFVHTSATQAFAIDKLGGESFDFSAQDGGSFGILVETGGVMTIDTPTLDIEGATQIHDTQAGDLMNVLKLSNDSSSAGSAAGLCFSVQTNDICKTGIFFENTAGDANGRGDLYIALDQVDDVNPVQIGDAVLTANYSDGSVGITNDFYVDTDTLFVDASTDRVAIGTTTPSTDVHIASTNDPSIATEYTDAGSFLEMRSGNVKSTIGYDSSEDGLLIGPVAAIRDTPSTGLFLDASGNVGVKTVTPDQPLSVAGDAIIGQDVTTGLSHLYIGEQVNADQTLVLEYDHDNNLGTLRIGGDASPLGLTVADGGDIGIGTTDPKANLHILTSGTSGLGVTPADKGVVITGEVGQSRLYFENVSSDAGERVFEIINNTGVLSFDSLNDTASSFTNQYILALEHDTGNVGGGTGAPEYPFHVTHASAGYALIETDANANDTGLLFRNSVGESGYVKGGIFFKNDLSGNGRGDMYFALENTSDSSNVDITDAKMTIRRTGNVEIVGDLSIGDDTPLSPLHISSLSAGSLQEAIRVCNPSTTTDTATGMMFSVAPASQDYAKAGIFFESDEGIGWARGDMIFALDNASDINDVSMADEKMRLSREGDLSVTNDANIGGLIGRSLSSAITASTTQTQGQQPLTSNVNNVTTVANANDVVTLPAASATVSHQIVIYNSGANTLQIFPASGDDLGAGVDTSTTLAAGANVTFGNADDTNWRTE